MSYEHRGRMSLDYDPVAYPGSVLRFRGPVHDVDTPHVLCLGGSETFGRFIHAPFAAQLDDRLDGGVVNMGVMNAGLDVLMQDAAIAMALRHARAVVLQITGAQNMTNRFYAVHPRRNDRFVKATTILQTIYPEVDFTEFHFTRHLLTHLKSTSEERFALLVEELKTAWLARMMRLLKGIDAPVHLLWLSRRSPDDGQGPLHIGDDPLFVSRAMLDSVAARAVSLTIAVGPTGRDTRPGKGMFFAAGEEAAARALPGPDAHDLAAGALHKLLA